MTDKITLAEVQELRRLNEKRTKGPWEVEDPFGPEQLSIVVGDEVYDWRFVANLGTDSDRGKSTRAIHKTQQEANAAFIALLANKADALLDLAEKALASEGSAS